MAADAQLNIVAKLQDEVSKPLGSMGMSFGKLAGGVAAGIGIYNLASSAINGLKTQITESVKAAEDNQASLAQLDAVLKSTGGAAGMTKDELVKLSEQMQHTTTYSHEQVMGVEDLLLTFTNLHKKTLPETTTAVLNVATAMHEDLKSASIQVGKAMNDPAVGMTMLRRIGVSFTAQQIEMAKQMEKSGNMAGAQAVVMGELNKEFGGSAQAQVNTYAGRMQQLKNNFTDIKEKVGDAILQGLQPFMEALARFVDSDRFQRWVNISVTYIQAFFTLLAQTARYINSDIIPPFLKFAEATGKLALQVYTFLKPSLDSLFKAIQDDLLPVLMKLWKEVIVPLAPIVGIVLVGAIWLLINALTIMIKVWSFTENVLIDVASFFGKVVQAIGSTAANVVNFFNNLPRTITAAASNFGSLLYNAGKDLIQGLINGINSAIGGVGRAIGNVASGAIKTVKGILGIHSPSTVFAEIGKNVGAGMVKGLNSSIGDVQDAMSGLTASASGNVTVSAAGNAQGSSPAGSVTNIYGDINLDSSDAVEAFFARIGRNQELAAKGLTPVRSV